MWGWGSNPVGSDLGRPPMGLSDGNSDRKPEGPFSPGVTLTGLVSCTSSGVTWPSSVARVGLGRGVLKGSVRGLRSGCRGDRAACRAPEPWPGSCPSPGAIQVQRPSAASCPVPTPPATPQRAGSQGRTLRHAGRRRPRDCGRARPRRRASSPGDFGACGRPSRNLLVLHAGA